MAQMSNMVYFLPMAKRVLLVAFDGADGLDIFGPAEVFYGAGRRLGAPVYTVVVAAAGARSVELTSGLPVAARELGALRPRAGRHRARRRRRRPRHGSRGGEPDAGRAG